MAKLDTAAELRAAIQAAGSVRAAARKHGIARTTLVSRLERFEREEKQLSATPGSEPVEYFVDGDTVTITGPVGEWKQPTQLLQDHGLNPDEWIVTRARPNTWQMWGGEEIGTVDLHQLKLEATRRVPADMVLPAQTAGWKPVRRMEKPRVTTNLIAVVSDTHAPYHDEGLHECFLQWLKKHRPAKAYDLGDILDLPIPSRHRVKRKFNASPQECVNTRYRVDAERVAASVDTEWNVLLGNHDERIDHALTDRGLDHLARLCPAEDELPALDLGRLLRYDELGITLIRPESEYHGVVIELAPGLFGRHGTKSGKHGGAVKAADRRPTHQAQGHDHKQVLHQHVVYSETGDARSYWTISTGAMCQRDLGYVEDPDTAQGFLTVTLHEDGSWHPELARYDAATRKLYWRGEQYAA